MFRQPLRLFITIFAVACVLNLALYTLGFAQDANAPGQPWYKPLVSMLFMSVLPALWAAIGPLATSWITKQVNKVSVYVPRPVQVVVSAVVTAGLAGLTGDPSGVVQAGVMGASGQILAATDPATLRTQSPVEAGATIAAGG